MIDPQGEIVLQRGHKGRFISGLLHGRFQVMETRYGESFILADQQLGGFPVMTTSKNKEDRDQTILHLPTREAAEEHAGFLAGLGQKPSARKPVATSAAPAQKAQKRTRAAVMHERLLKGDTPEAASAAVAQEFGPSAYTAKYAEWYRKQMVKKGQLPS